MQVMDMQEWQAVVEEAEQFLQADVLLQLAESAPRLAGALGCVSGWSHALHGVSCTLQQSTATGQTAPRQYMSVRQEGPLCSSHRVARASQSPAAAV